MNQSATLQSKTLSLTDRLAYGLATGFGAGLAPKAPGTFGALESIAVFVVLLFCGLTAQAFFITLLVLDVVSFLVGWWASGRTCTLTSCEDPRQIVIDEINGQFVALTPLALSAGAPSWQGVLLAFILFRMFDILKPYPINRLEALHGGLGVMADDTLSGIYAAAPIALLVYFNLI